MSNNFTLDIKIDTVVVSANMDLFEAIEKRRSIRKFESKKFPDEAVEKALKAAILAPNSSNTQTWDFYWIQTEEKRKAVVKNCLNQSAARTASQLVVVAADPTKWRRSIAGLRKWVKDASAPKPVELYYQKLIPFTYQWGWFNVFGYFKIMLAFLIGIFRPITRGPHTRDQLNEVAIKSAGLAAENFVLAITAQGGATCMMEGLDEWRMKRTLSLPSTTRIVMAIAIGYEAERGTWAGQYRIPFDQVVHRI